MFCADGFEGNCGIPSFSANFSTDAASWPAPWIGVGGLDLSDVQSGRLRLRPVPSSYTLARMWAPVLARDVEVRFPRQIEHSPSQGVAFLVRHNGGFLTQTTPMGQGYGVFIEGTFRGASNAGIGIWKESAGVESILAHSPASVFGPNSIAEPIAWQVSVVDSTLELQNLSGGIGVDPASGILAPDPVTANALVDDIKVTPLCNPIIGLGTDGRLYFTDPDFGLTNPPVNRELQHNSLYRRAPDGTLSLEWMGTIGVNQPNGVQLSLDGTFLFLTDTSRGELRRWNVAASGALSNPVILASGLSVADGMCMDSAGNIYVTVASGVEIFNVDGARWGNVAIPRMAANCAFGDSDGRSLYVTARQGLYRVR